MKLITTSWDDGHPLDLRLAELLDKYNLKGTFYIPKANAEREVMSEAQMQTLAKNFEIGGHTLHHVRLHNVNEETLQKEIGGSYNWLKEVTGTAPVSFCFPGGVYTASAIKTAQACGYKVLRTAELLSIKHPPTNALLPTTLQVYPHSRFTYFRHLIKYGRGKNLVRWMAANSSANLTKLTAQYLQQIENADGCFHLWGHSWEIEENNLWPKLEQLLSLLSNRPGFTYSTNGDLGCE